jgi:agmatinase
LLVATVTESTDTNNTIAVLDPSIAPATGTPESGGWTTRELKRYIEGLEGLNLVGADVVEVSPPYDSVTETTSGRSGRFDYRYLAAMVKQRSPDFKIGSSSSKDEL